MLADMAMTVKAARQLVYAAAAKSERNAGGLQHARLLVGESSWPAPAAELGQTEPAEPPAVRKWF